MKKLIIFRDATVPLTLDEDTKVISFSKLKESILTWKLFEYYHQHFEVVLFTFNQNFFPRPFNTFVILKLFTKKDAFICDEQGSYQKITTNLLIQRFYQLILDFITKKNIFKQINQELHILSLAKLNLKALSISPRPIYLRTDLCFGLQSGGSVGHIAGVLNNLHHFGGDPIFLTTDHIPTVDPVIETYRLEPPHRYWDFPEVPFLYHNISAYPQAKKILQTQTISFIYQRYSMENYLGVKLAQEFNLPFVLEYNGSEIWINRNWGTPLKYETLAAEIEALNLKIADVIVVVSQPMKDELVARNIDPDKILVNPNGVDPNRYSPTVDGQPIREKYHLSDKIVVGFIGTFGKWHGAEVLAEAFGQLLTGYPELKSSVRLLMIGDGITMPQVKANLEKYQIQDYCILTGTVPQAEGPTYLAACDILASPHVPNPDGTPFFGSPTKLFEYMAMGKGIVASDLDQIGQILDHDHTAWLVEPGNATALAHGIKALIDDPERRQRLGQAARATVVEHYTWEEHTRKIITKLQERCSG